VPRCSNTCGYGMYQLLLNICHSFEMVSLLIMFLFGQLSNTEPLPKRRVALNWEVSKGLKGG